MKITLDDYKMLGAERRMLDDWLRDQHLIDMGVLAFEYDSDKPGIVRVHTFARDQKGTIRVAHAHGEPQLVVMSGDYPITEPPPVPVEWRIIDMHTEAALCGA